MDKDDSPLKITTTIVLFVVVIVSTLLLIRWAVMGMFDEVAKEQAREIELVDNYSAECRDKGGIPRNTTRSRTADWECRTETGGFIDITVPTP